MAKSTSFRRNLIDLIKTAHQWEYTEINDTKESLKKKKPILFFTKVQVILIVIAMALSIICKSGINAEFAGYIISALSLFVGLLFTLVVSIFDKFSQTDFTKYKFAINCDLYPIGVTLKNFYKKTIVLTLYTSIIAIVCISALTIVILFPEFHMQIDFCDLIAKAESRYLKIFILLYRTVLFYFLLNFIYITLLLITSFFDYMVGKIDEIKLK